MSKKKLLEFGLKEADAFQKNFKIIFDRLVRGYKSMMGREPEGLDLLKVKMEAREKALGTTKVVNQKGLTLDPDKPITGGTQEGIPTIKTKFDEELDEFNLSKDDPMGDLEKIVKGEGETGLPKKEIPRDVKETFEEELGVKLYGDETFDELMIIKNTGKHPRDKADGGRIGLSIGGPSNIIGSDLSRPGAGLLGGMEVGGDEFADIEGQTAGLGVLSYLTKTFGPTIGGLIFNRGRKKVIFDPAVEAAKKRAADIKKAREAEQLREVANRAAANRAAGRGGYQSSFGRDEGFMGGRGTAAEMGSFADGGLATMFVEKR
jgi:hypothetical protein